MRLMLVAVLAALSLPALGEESSWERWERERVARVQKLYDAYIAAHPWKFIHQANARTDPPYRAWVAMHEAWGPKDQFERAFGEARGEFPALAKDVDRLDLEAWQDATMPRQPPWDPPAEGIITFGVNSRGEGVDERGNLSCELDFGKAFPIQFLLPLGIGVLITLLLRSAFLGVAACLGAAWLVGGAMGVMWFLAWTLGISILLLALAKVAVGGTIALFR